MLDEVAGLSAIAAGMKALQRFVQKLIGIDDLERRVRMLEKEMAFIQKLIASVLGTLGQYKDRTEGQLEHMKEQIDAMLKEIEQFMESTEQACEEVSSDRMSACLGQARALRSRLRLNRTLIEKHLNN